MAISSPHALRLICLVRLHRCILLYGVGTYYPATYHESADHKEEREIKWVNYDLCQREKIIFLLAVLFMTILFLPAATPLVACSASVT